MAASKTLVTSSEMHRHLVEQLNSALRRPGMYGGQTTLLLLVHQLLFMERRPQAWDEYKRLLEERGAWYSTGVTGVFRHLFPDNDDEHGASSVFAEFAFQCDWLRPDRVLDTRAYDALSSSVHQWARTDRVWADVVEEFGAPSVLFGPISPFHGKTLGYLTDDPHTPMVFFHLGGKVGPGAAPSGQPPRPESILLAVRLSGGSFPADLTFTPEGRRLRPAPADNDQ